MVVNCLPCEIYKYKGGDCSNNGISSRYNEILLICDNGFVVVDDNDPPENLCKVVTKKYSFGTFTHVEPVARPNGAGWMMGGCLVYTPDSRFGSEPLKLFDCCESSRDSYLFSD